MEFGKKEFDNYIKKLTLIGIGSQGVCYLDRQSNIVIKVFHDYFDNIHSTYNKDQILKFSNIKNNTFIWPSDIVTVNNNIIGYISPYKNANNLYKLDPLLINLDLFELAIKKAMKDVHILTNNGVKIYDIMYNILHTRGAFYVIDTFDIAKEILVII